MYAGADIVLPLTVENLRPPQGKAFHPQGGRCPSGHTGADEGAGRGRCTPNGRTLIRHGLRPCHLPPGRGKAFGAFWRPYRERNPRAIQ